MTEDKSIQEVYLYVFTYFHMINVMICMYMLCKKIMYNNIYMYILCTKIIIYMNFTHEWQDPK